MSVILLFIDGVGLGEEADYNPWYTVPTPRLEGILGGSSLVRRAAGSPAPHVTLLAADACLGVEGIPQSATGQATIFTGRNAPAAMGTHQSGLPFRRLREWVERDNLYHHFSSRGLTAAFANSYTPEYFERPKTRRGWISVSTAAAKSGEGKLLTLEDLLTGRAVYHDLTRRTLAKMRPEVKEIQPEEAARHLLGLARQHDLTVHEYFLSDLAGHRRDHELIEWVIRTYDRFLGAVLDGKKEEDTVILVSDHGNSEDFRVRTHTQNTVPLLLLGRGAETVGRYQKEWDLTCVAPLLLQVAEACSRVKWKGE
ncbi:hypothetical protein [Salinithrix halophila]|uniref:Metalloenzyme domain-containing protein n=1 Tax=Salinithrix halophila TaxID=1485204 RepID=A0ABV8JG73_9BACL